MEKSFYNEIEERGITMPFTLNEFALERIEETPEKEKYNWAKFTEYANREGISLDDEEDYGPWWDCWKEGYICAISDVIDGFDKRGHDEPER